MTRSATSKKIVVELDTQTVKAYADETVVFAFSCVTGDKLHPTEPGIFQVLSRDKDHLSHKYNVPMHYALFFTRDGKALHQYHGLMPLPIIRALKENVTDYLGSHGCVRLVEADAIALFDWTSVGTPVHIRGRLT